MPGLDPFIMVHEIKTYPIAKPIRKKLRQVHPQKVTAIKSKGNLCNITKTTRIDISVKPGTIEHVHVGENCSTKETEA